MHMLWRLKKNMYINIRPLILDKKIKKSWKLYESSFILISESWKIFSTKNNTPKQIMSTDDSQFEVVPANDFASDNDNSSLMSVYQDIVRNPEFFLNLRVKNLSEFCLFLIYNIPMNLLESHAVLFAIRCLVGYKWLVYQVFLCPKA